MTKNEAKSAIKEGKKVTHWYFTDDEYIYHVHGNEYFEDGVRVPKDWWDKDYLEDGWSLWTE